MREHDQTVCGIYYEDSCSGCQIGFLKDERRRSEIPTDDLKYWLDNQILRPGNEWGYARDEMDRRIKEMVKKPRQRPRRK